MKIACLRTYRLYCPLPEFLGFSQGREGAREALLVQIVTDDGAEGWGECAGPAAVAQAAITTFYGPPLIGQDALQTDVLWHQMWRSSLNWARRGVMMGAISGIDMALWDLKGRVLKQPLCEMLGGRFRDRVPCYVSGLYFRDRPEAERIPSLIEEAHGYVEEGYRAVKVQIGRNLSYDSALIRAVRRALPDTPLLADANHAYDLPEAIGIGRVLEDANFSWFEEPLSPELPGQFRHLAGAVRVSLAAGENEQTRWGFQTLLAPGGLHVAQPDMSYCGGPSEAQKIRAVAGSLGVNLVPHTGGTMLNLAAALHFLASDFRQPGRAEAAIGLLERDGPPNPLRDVLFSETLAIEHGVAEVPTAPGLGVTVDTTEMHFFCLSREEVTGAA